MSGNRQDFSSKLAKARQQLQKAQARVADLETQLFKDQPNPAALLDGDSSYHRVLDNLLEGAEIIGFDWRYLYVNDASAGHGRQSKDVLLRSTVIELYPGIENTAMFATLRTCMEERTAQHFETEFVFPDGEVAWFDLSVQPIPEGIFILSLDITERKWSETAIKRYAQRMEILHQIDLGIINAASIQEVVEIALKGMRQIIPCQRADVMILNETTDEALIFAIDFDSDTSLQQGLRVAFSSNVFEGYDSRHIRVFDDFRPLQDTMPRAKRLVNEGLLCALSALLMDRERPMGVLGLFADTPGFFTIEHQEIAAEIANQLAIAIRQLQLSEEVSRHSVELEQNNADLRQAEAALKRFAKRMEILHQIDLAIIRGGSVEALVEAVLKHIRQLIPCQRVSASLFDETKDEMLVFAADLNRPSAVDKGIRVSLPSNWLDGYAADHAKIIDDIRLLDDLIPTQKQLLNEGLVTFLHVLLTVQGRPIGLLALSTDTPGFFTAEYREIAIEIANQLAIAVHQLHLTEELARHAAELEQRVIERTADLNDAKKRVEAILNNSTDGIFLVHTDLNIRQTNSSFDSLFACAPDDYFGKPLFALVHAEDFDAVTNILQTVVAEKRGKSIEIRSLRKNGTVFDTELSIGHIKDDGLVCTIRDITERKAQERQLRYLASLQESVVDAVIVTDTEFHIQTWNTGAERIYGWKADEVIGKAAPDLLKIRMSSTQNRDSVRQTLNEEGFTQQETIQQRKDGSDIFILGSATLLADEHGKSVGVISVNRDITERKAQERQLRYQATLQENVSDAVIVTDTTFRIQSWNKAAERIYGWRAEDVVGTATAEVLQTKYPSTIDQEGAIQQLREQGWWQGEVIQHHKDGSMRHILGSVTFVKDENGLPFGIVSVNHDITERKKTEEALREIEERFSLLVNSVDDYAIYMLDTQGNVVSWNQGAQRIKGYSAEEVIGQNFERFYLPEAMAKGEPQRNLNAARSTGHFVEEGWRVRKDGRRLWADVTITPLRDKQNQLIGYAKVTHDLTERKQVEEALRESEEKFRLLMDAAPIAIIITNESGHITLVNNQAETIFGYHRAELVGQSVDMLLPDAARDRHASNRATYLAAPRVRRMGIGLELSARRKDTIEFPVEVELSYIKTQAGLLVMSFVLDITERKRVAAELEQQRSFLRNVIDVSPSMIFVKDYNARFVLANPIVAKMYDTSVETLIGKTDADFDPSLKEVGDFLEADRRVIDSGEPLFLEEPLTSSTGETHWLQTTKVPIISVDGKSKYVLGISTDITERRQAEDALREQHEFLQLVINSVPGLITVKDRYGRIQLVNKHEADLYGIAPDDMLGKINSDFNSNQDEVSFFLEKDRETLETGQTVFIPEETVLGRYYQTSKIPLKNRGGEYDRLLVVASDITERKQAEEALRQAFEKEKELGELKSRFVSMASHEFRTPLATILAVTETLSAYRHKLPEDQIELRFGKIKDQVSHLTDIMDDVLLLARMQARRVDFNPVKLNLDDLCRSVIDEFQSRPDVTHKLLYTCDEQLHEVTLDKKLMRQIINNLMSNAVKYSPSDKTITVSLAYENKGLILKVQDEGIGIPEADLKYLFEPFHRAANVGAISGTGLGMVITKEAVELHGGTITVESHVGTGTAFTVSIPLVRE